MALYDDKANQAGVDKLMDFSEKDEKPIVPSDDYDPETTFMQKGINAYADATGSVKPVKEDGILGPKTQGTFQEILRGMPPEMKRWAVNSLHKGMKDLRSESESEGDGGAGNTEGFQSPIDDGVEEIEENPFG